MESGADLGSFIGSQETSGSYYLTGDNYITQQKGDLIFNETGKDYDKKPEWGGGDDWNQWTEQEWNDWYNGDWGDNNTAGVKSYSFGAVGAKKGTEAV